MREIEARLTVHQVVACAYMLPPLACTFSGFPCVAGAFVHVFRVSCAGQSLFLALFALTQRSWLVHAAVGVSTSAGWSLSHSWRCSLSVMAAFVTVYVANMALLTRLLVNSQGMYSHTMFIMTAIVCGQLTRRLGEGEGSSAVTRAFKGAAVEAASESWFSESWLLSVLITQLSGGALAFVWRLSTLVPCCQQTLVEEQEEAEEGAAAGRASAVTGKRAVYVALCLVATSVVVSITLCHGAVSQSGWPALAGVHRRLSGLSEDEPFGKLLLVAACVGAQCFIGIAIVCARQLWRRCCVPRACREPRGPVASTPDLCQVIPSCSVPYQPPRTAWQ